MPPGAYGGYRGDPRGRSRAIASRQQGQADVQSQVDSFSAFNPKQDTDDSTRRSRISRQNQMRSRTFSAPPPAPKTPVQKSYNELQIKTPDMTSKKSVAPTPIDVPQKSIFSEAATSTPAKVAYSTLAATTAIGVKQRASDIKQIQGFLKSNQGLSLTEAQKAAIRYGSKVPNALAKQAYGAGSWLGWLGGRTAAHHFGPVEFAMKGLGSVGKMLGPVGLLHETYKSALGGTTALLEATGGDKFLSQLGSNIAQKTGATTTPQSAWIDLLRWVEEQGG